MEITLYCLMIFIFAFFIVANIAVQIIGCILNIIIVPRFGLKILSASIFGFIFIRDNNQWKVSFHHLSLICQCHNGYDVKIPIPEDSFEREKRASYLIKALTVLISLLMAFVLWYYFSGLFQGKGELIQNIFMGVFVISTVAGMIFFPVANLGLCIYAFQTSAKRMSGYVDGAIQKIR